MGRRDPLGLTDEARRKISPPQLQRKSVSDLSHTANCAICYVLGHAKDRGGRDCRTVRSAGFLLVVAHFQSPEYPYPASDNSFRRRFGEPGQILLQRQPYRLEGMQATLLQSSHSIPAA